MILQAVPMGDRALMITQRTAERRRAIEGEEEMRTADWMEESAQDRTRLSSTGITPTRRSSGETCPITPRTVTLNRGSRVDEGDEEGRTVRLNRTPEDSSARNKTFRVDTRYPRIGGLETPQSNPIVWEEDEPAVIREAAKELREQEMMQSPSRKYITPRFSTPMPKDSQENAASWEWKSADDFFRNESVPDSVEDSLPLLKEDVSVSE